MAGFAVGNWGASCRLWSTRWNWSEAAGLAHISGRRDYAATSSWRDEPALESFEIKKLSDKVSGSDFGVSSWTWLTWTRLEGIFCFSLSQSKSQRSFQLQSLAREEKKMTQIIQRIAMQHLSDSEGIYHFKLRNYEATECFWVYKSSFAKKPGKCWDKIKIMISKSSVGLEQELRLSSTFFHFCSICKLSFATWFHDKTAPANSIKYRARGFAKLCWNFTQLSKHRKLTTETAFWF